MTRIGIYGGTFSPPHNGHVLAAEEFVKCADLDELIITVTWTPPHKQADNGSTPYQRLEMATLAFASVEKATVSDYEIEKKNKEIYLLKRKIARLQKRIKPKDFESDLFKKELDLFIMRKY